jgi:hypothetical protein
MAPACDAHVGAGAGRFKRSDGGGGSERAATWARDRCRPRAAVWSAAAGGQDGEWGRRNKKERPTTRISCVVGGPGSPLVFSETNRRLP